MADAAATKEAPRWFREALKSPYEDRKVDVDPKSFTLQLEEAKADAQPAGAKRYTGDLKWLEPFVTRKAQTLHVELETWQDAIGTLATVKGYPDVVLRIKHIHGDWNSDEWDLSDLRCNWYPPKAPAACVCEVVKGSPPESWETCTPYGHYRVAAKDLILEGEACV